MKAKSIRLGITRVLLTAAALLIGSSTALACPVCFGAEETSMIDGAKLGIMALLGVTLSVQGAFVGFFVYLWKHARQNADIELDMEWAELQRGSRRS